MRKKYKVWLIVIVVLLVLTIGLGVLKIFIGDKSKIKNVTNVVSKIDEFGYTLDDRDTKYMKDEFKKLEKVLTAKEINYEEYAKYLSELFVIDFYTLNNKINKYDVGSLEYIYSEKRDDFRLKAMDTVYGSVNDNTYKDRVQKLPEVTNVKVLDVEETSVDINEENKEGYKVSMEYTYKEDLGYDDKGIVILAKNGNKLEVVNYDTKDSGTSNITNNNDVNSKSSVYSEDLN